MANYNVIHGHGRRGKQTKIYRVWIAMIGRCEHQTHLEWRNYGARGIRVCRRWLNFMNFYADMGPCPSGHSLERKDNNSGYSPRNCVWATPAQQARNRRNTIRLQIDGVDACLLDHCNRYGINRTTALMRIRRGWSPEDAIKLTPNIHVRYRKRLLERSAKV